MDIQIRKMTPALVEDYFKFFDEVAFFDHPEWGCDCYCCFYHAASAKEWEARTGAQNKAQAREMILADKLTGLLAYVDGLPVAWCHYERKDLLPGIKAFYPEFLSVDSEGAVRCEGVQTVKLHTLHLNQNRLTMFFPDIFLQIS